MDGGGRDQAVPLTADLVARAVIAAAQAYGDDPVETMTSAYRNKRRALTAAISGLNLATDIPVARICAIFDVSKSSVFVNRAPSQRRPAFTQAEVAAMRAAEFACWRPEAAESVAGVDEPDEISGDDVDDRLEALATGAARIGAFGAQLEALGDAGWEAIDPGGCAPPILAGRITSNLRPPQPAPARPADDSPMADLVLGALADGPLNTMSIASLLDRKEMAVVSTLSNLERLGLVVSAPAPDNAPRRFVWSRVTAADEAAA